MARLSTDNAIKATCALIEFKNLDATKIKVTHDAVEQALALHVTFNREKGEAYAFKLQEHASFALLIRDKKPSEAEKEVEALYGNQLSCLLSPGIQINIGMASRAPSEPHMIWYLRAREQLFALLMSNTDNKKGFLLRRAKDSDEGGAEDGTDDTKDDAENDALDLAALAASAEPFVPDYDEGGDGDGEGKEGDGKDHDDEGADPAVDEKEEDHKRELMREIRRLTAWLYGVANDGGKLDLPDSPSSFYAMFADGHVLCSAMHNVLQHVPASKVKVPDEDKQINHDQPMAWFHARCVDLGADPHLMRAALRPNELHTSFADAAHFFYSIFEFHIVATVHCSKLHPLNTLSKFSDKFLDHYGGTFSFGYLGKLEPVQGYLNLFQIHGFGKHYCYMPSIRRLVVYVGQYRNGVPHGWGQIESQTCAAPYATIVVLKGYLFRDGLFTGALSEHVAINHYYINAVMAIRCIRMPTSQPM